MLTQIAYLSRKCQSNVPNSGMDGWPQNWHYHPLAVALVSCRKEEKTVVVILDHGKHGLTAEGSLWEN